MNTEILRELKEQTKWLRFLSLPGLKDTIKNTICSKEQKRIFELTDGKLSTNDISKKLQQEGVKASHMTVYNYWKRWYAIGLVEPSEEYTGRFKKIVELSDLNL
ncbi:MAG: hypothetical protein J0M37_12315 [Ignavibacteria bacterium]|nr:hypothetical protein [Ignavibacteria bacterium]